jgi:ATP-dependent DNA helicase RecQ
VVCGLWSSSAPSPIFDTTSPFKPSTACINSWPFFHLFAFSPPAHPRLLRILEDVRRQLPPDSDEQRRQLYVAITRAKTNLTVHYNGTYLQRIRTEGLSYIRDNGAYQEVQQVALLLNHKDVQLGYFDYVQHRLSTLHSGSSLTILDDGLGNKMHEKVIQFSKKFKEALDGWIHRGFEIESANVNFIVYWKDEEKGREVRIVLPELYLRKEI